MKKNIWRIKASTFFNNIYLSAKSLVKNHENDEIGKIYNKTFFNRGGIVDRFKGVLSFIDDMYTNLNNFKNL